MSPESAGHAGVCVRVYVNEGDTWHGQPLAEAILRRLREQGCAGATILRGWAGFGSHGEIHAARMVDTMPPLPLIVEWIERPEQAQRLLPVILPMIGEGAVIQFPVEVVRFTHRALRPLPTGPRVGEVMTQPVTTVEATTPLRDLVAGLIDRDHRAVLVVDSRAGERLVGIVTNGDLVERGGLTARVHLLSALGPEAVRQELDGLASSPRVAADVMTREVVTATPETPVRAAARLMDERHLKRLPVVDHAGRPVGIVSRVDLLRTLATTGPAGVSSFDRAPDEDADSMGARVGAIAVRRVPTVRPDASLSEVLDAVISTRLSRAVVVDAHSRPLGVISDAEVLRRVDPAARPGVLATLMRRLPFRQGAPPDPSAERAAHATRAADLMLTDVPVVAAETAVPVAIDRMLQSRRKILPVVDEHGVLVGMVDRADLLRAVARDANASEDA